MDRIIEVKIYGNHITKDSKTAGVRGEANITKLRISFDEGWDGYAKDIVFWDAYGENPVRIVLTTDLLEDKKSSTRVYLVAIPAEPMARAGELTFTVYGSVDNKKQASATAKLEVKASPNVLQPVDPTPSELQQMQAEIEDVIGDIQDAVIATDKINNMTVSAETLSTGDEASVEKSEHNGVTNLHFGLPKGDRGLSGVYIGDTEPTDPDINVWIDPNGTDAARTTGGSVVTSVKMFGAVGNGVADDTEAIKRAARCGRTIYFPAGTYLLYGQIDMTADINWIGEGEKTVIKIVPSSDADMIHHSKQADRGYSISLQGLVLDGNETNQYQANCIYLDSPSLVYMHNVRITHGSVSGCHIFGAGGVEIVNCRFNDNGWIVWNGSGLLIEDMSDGVKIANCEFSNNKEDGLKLNNVRGAIISGIASDYSTHGVMFNGSHENVLSCARCSNNDTGVGLWENCVGNTISGLITEGNEYGMLFGDCDKVVVSGWNSIGDNYRYRADYFYMTKEVKGTVFGIFDTDNCMELGKTEENKSIFKVNFIGG